MFLLRDYLNRHFSYELISELLGRSKNGIVIAAHRKLHYQPKCLSCGERIEHRKGNRLRCPDCVVKHNKKMKQLYDGKNREHFKILKNELRFGGNRQKTMERDNYTCQMCGKTHHEVVLDVHHKDKTGRNKNEHNHSPDNLITLCHNCHTKQHKEDTIMVRWKKRKYWDKDWLYKQYITLKKTPKQIAEENKCSDSSIYRWLKKHRF